MRKAFVMSDAYVWLLLKKHSIENRALSYRACGKADRIFSSYVNIIGVLNVDYRVWASKLYNHVDSCGL